MCLIEKKLGTRRFYAWIGNEAKLSERLHTKEDIWKITLKDMCIKLLLSLTFYKDNEGNLVLLFKDAKYDKIASLITYGNGVIPGSKILQVALRN